MAVTLSSPRSTGIDFASSVALDLVNAMYFTALAESHEGLDEWPIRTRERMDPALRGELDLLFSYPRHEPGIMGALNDTLFFHREAWGDVEALLRFVRELPAEGTPDPQQPGIQGLALYALRWPGHDGPYQLPDGVTPHDAMVGALAEAGSKGDIACTPPREGECDPSTMLALFDEPEDVRARVLHLVRRFYDEHYRPDEARRLACMGRSVAAHDRDRAADVEDLTRRLTGRHASCLDTVCTGDYASYVFVPSVDVGLYNSCVSYSPLHALYYPCEPQYRGMPDEDDATRRMALVYRALSDEQRLRILRLLRDGELYAQEIVERTGLHQSVVSRHLTFMKAVGLVNARRQNNMKFYSLNSDAGDELRQAVEVFLPASRARSGYQDARSAT